MLPITTEPKDVLSQFLVLATDIFSHFFHRICEPPKFLMELRPDDLFWRRTRNCHQRILELLRIARILRVLRVVRVLIVLIAVVAVVRVGVHLRLLAPIVIIRRISLRGIVSIVVARLSVRLIRIIAADIAVVVAWLIGLRTAIRIV